MAYRPFGSFGSEVRPVLLTFDDGPNGDATLGLLDVLRGHNVKAVFTVIGENVENQPDVARRIRNDGHVVANHGYTDRPLVFRSRSAARAEMAAWISAVRAALGDTAYSPEFFRPAMGWYRPSTVRIARENGMMVLGFSSYALDAQRGPKGRDRVVRRAERRVAHDHGGVVVFHDGKNSHDRLARGVARGCTRYDRSWIPEAVDSLITRLESTGHTFPHLDEQLPGRIDSVTLHSIGRVLIR